MGTDDSQVASAKREVVVLLGSDSKQDQDSILRSRDVLQNAFWLRKREPNIGQRLKVKTENKAMGRPQAKSQSSEKDQPVLVPNTTYIKQKER